MVVARYRLGIALLLAALAGCSFRVMPGAGGDAAIDAEVIPDADVCTNLDKMCVTSTVLRDCQEAGKLPVDIPCSWGCVDGVPPAHCGQLQPTGSVVTMADLMEDPALLDATTTNANGVIDTGTGAITNLRAAGPDVSNGIDFEVRSFPVPGGGTRNVGVFRLRSLTLVGSWNVRGPNALAIVSLGDVVIQGELDVRGDCMNVNAGPGGFPGGASNTDAAGPGGGSRGVQSGGGGNDSSGGGGGAYGANGGDGGRAGSSPPGRPGGGTSWGDAAITLLLGGGGGGGGGSGGAGGGGGGAIHIAANGKVSLRVEGTQTSGINAGGCGGDRGSTDAGGGGGAGGAILIEAPEVELDDAHLAVNGGGGGGGLGSGTPGNGGDGQLGIARASGGQGGGGGGANGGRGGASANLAGETGSDADNAGGGGGGVGRIRVNTRLTTGVTLKNSATVSPTFEESNTTATKTTATVR